MMTVVATSATAMTTNTFGTAKLDQPYYKNTIEKSMMSQKDMDSQLIPNNYIMHQQNTDDSSSSFDKTINKV